MMLECTQAPAISQGVFLGASNMTNAEMIEKFVNDLTKKIKFRMEEFGDSYEKAKACIQMQSCAGTKCWAIVDKNFS
jgi:hypothetical protein